MQKRTCQLILLSIILVCSINGSAFATSFSVNILGPIYARHWDSWGVEYDSNSKKYQTKVEAGNAAGTYGAYLEIASDTGIVGEKVPVELSYRIQTNMYASGINTRAPLNPSNFAGSDHFDAWINYDFGTSDQKLFYSAHNIDPWTLFNEDITITLNTVLETYKPIFVSALVGANHDTPIASGLKAVDQTQDFRVYYTVQGLVEVTSIKIFEPATFLLLGTGLIGIAGCFRKKIKG